MSNLSSVSTQGVSLRRMLRDSLFASYGCHVVKEPCWTVQRECSRTKGGSGWLRRVEDWRTPPAHGDSGGDAELKGSSIRMDK